MLSTKITIKDRDFKQKKTKGNQLGSTRQACHVFLKELSLRYRNAFN